METTKEHIHKFKLDMIENNDYSLSTINTYLVGVKQFFNRYKEFSNTNARLFVSELESNGLKPQTILLRINGLIRFSKYIGVPIVIKRPKIKRVLSLENVPTEAEYNILLDYLHQKQLFNYYFIVKVLGTTGARVSELLKMTWEDIQNGEVTIKGKGGKYRLFFFKNTLSSEVKLYCLKHKVNGCLAKNRYGGIMTSRGLAGQLKAHSIACGVDPKKTHPHAFRHFFAKMFLKRSKDIIQLADLLGHSSIDTTRIYLQRTYDEQKKDYNRNITW